MLWEDKLQEWGRHPVTRALIEEILDDVQRAQNLLEQENNMNDVRLTQGILREAQEVLGMLINLDIKPIEGAEDESD